MKEFTVLFYNTENLYDTIDDPKTDDNEFLPEGDLQWTKDRYQRKLEHTSRVINAVNPGCSIDMFGLCEIENKMVLQDLLNTGEFKDKNYKIIHQDSDDKRGVDVALIYKADTFGYISHKIINVRLEYDPEFRTRDILYVKGKVEGYDIIHVFVNHWSSRREGEEETKPRRNKAASLVRKEVDEIFLENENAKIIIMGDLNDEPTSDSIRLVLNATNNRTPNSKFELYNLMYDLKLKGLGTAHHKGIWDLFDNLIVSHGLINAKEGLTAHYDDGKIFEPKWLQFHNPKTGELTPNRTYGGTNYFGGYSDHYPVYARFKIK